jgi:hypothetical protein
MRSFGGRAEVKLNFLYSTSESCNGIFGAIDEWDIETWTA